MDYLTVAQARDLPGLRLVLTAGVPGPWGEAAKAVLRQRNVEFAPVAQEAMAPNEDLLAWTGHRNAPIACLDDEAPLTGWLDILHLAERLGSGPSLLPADAEERALCLGFVTEIAGADGFGWNRRHLVIAASLGGSAAIDHTPAPLQQVYRSYALSDEAIARAPGRLARIMQALADRLRRQKAAGSPYFIGDSLTALDLYWASFSMMVRPLPLDVNPMPDWLMPLYSHCDPQTEAAIDPILIEHRDHIYERHIGLPLDY